MTKQTSITIQSLPDHVLSYLLTFTEKKDGVHFTSASVTLHHRLMKNFVRSMTFGFDEAIQLVHDTTHAKKVLDKMHNPYRQLSCFLPAEWKPSANSISSLCSLKVLECSYEVFSYSFLPSLDKVQQLMLFPNNWSNIATPATAAPVATETDGETDDEETAIINSDDANHKMESLTVEGMKSLLNTLAEKNRHNDLQLKHLIIDTCPLTEFPYIPSLSSLEIMNSSVLTSLSGYYRNLQKLVLRNIGSNDSSTSSISNGFYMNRKSFIDVSLFDAIHDVSFYSCSAISDISALNHCHSIIIYDCENILDYSKGFTNVHNIEIIDANEDAIIELTPAMKKVESLTVMTSKQANRSILTNGHNPTTLHKLQISGYPEYTHTHPSIRCLKIERCQDLTIDTTLQRVYALTLSHVNIDSLEGLINENTKVVTLDHCNEIEDFSPLREVSKVSILDCNGFNNVEEVNRVRHLIIRSLDKVMEIGSLEALGEYVQHLELRGKVEVDCEGLIGLENMSVIEIESFEMIENTRLEGLGNNDKIVLSISADECFEDISDILEEFSEMHDYNLSHVSNTQVVMKKRIGGLCM